MNSLPLNRYEGYAYAYPHKTAYRRFAQPVALRAAWAREDRRALSLYFHVPFCEMRCGFCNLFTTVNPQEDFTQAYLTALQRQAAQTRAALGESTFARFALGGGTPTLLSESALSLLFDLAENTFNIDPQRLPVSVETSPLTAATGKLRLLRARGVTRVSIGVQSFNETEAKAAGRAQRTRDVFTALERLRAAGFPTLNIDLIYGLPGQTVASWLESLQQALRFAPEELYLYPLYVRPQTGLQRRGQACAPNGSGKLDELRLACYRAGRAVLLARGYQQISMRMFQRTPASNAPAYCCQTDGLLGLGCGARSYTQALHYSNEYAVGATTIRAIIKAYLNRTDAEFAQADYGFALDEDEQRRRFLLQSLLQSEGLSRTAYRARFGADVLADFAQLTELLADELAVATAERLQLNEAGLELADAIGPWLYSARVRELMTEYELR